MIYIPTEKEHEYTIHPTTLWERIKFSWFVFRNPTKIQHRITFNDNEIWLLKNCNQIIMNETKNLVKVRD